MVDEDGATVDEASKVDASKYPRVLGEAFLISKGASILRLSGLMGEDSRRPKTWIESGRISNPEKLVNLVHVDDVVRFTALELLKPSNTFQGGVCNVSAMCEKWSKVAADVGASFPPAYPEKSGPPKKLQVALQNALRQNASQLSCHVPPAFPGSPQTLTCAMPER